jgi:hypothetical protein
MVPAGAAQQWTAPKPTYTAQQTAEAKAHMCTAFGKVENALHLADARNGSNDPTALLALAEGAWQAFDTGSRYLLTKLAEEPAIPPELATAVRDQANAFQELLINYLDGLHNSDPAMQPAVKASDAATLTIQRLCRWLRRITRRATSLSPSVLPTAFDRPARWPTFTALAAALVCLAVGSLGWFRPGMDNTILNQVLLQQPADPRAKSPVCDAFAKVDHALDVADARNAGGDPTLQLAVATGTRQVFDAGSRFLSTTLDDEPGTSPELAMAVRKQADSLQELTVGYLDGLPNSAPDQQPALTAMNESTAGIRRLCR